MKSPQGERCARVQTVHGKETCFGQVIYPPGGDCGPRTQLDYQLVIIHSGSGEVAVDEERHTLPVGRVVLLKPGCREYFRFAADRETHHSWCSIAPWAVPPALARSLSLASFSLSPSLIFERLLSTGMLMSPALRKTGGDVLTQVATALFAEFVHIAEMGSASAKLSEPLQRALGYMEDHFAEEDCLFRAFRCSGVSRSALIQCFARQVGQPPGRYLWRLRTERGVSMLDKTGLTISEIAYLCGFKTPFHFSRMVKQQQGCSPREVRGRAWNA